jgi:hypothetical protein
MKRINRIIAASFLVFLIPFAFASGQEKKTEQRIKIVVSDDGGSDVILDTLITGKPLSDSIVMKNGKTIYLAHEGIDNGDNGSDAKKYIITSTVSDGGDNKKQVNKEIMIISSDSDIAGQSGMDKCKHTGSGSMGTEKTYTYTIDSQNKETDSEKTRYVISRDGIRITVEGSDYDKVKDVIKDIEKTLDSKGEMK